MAYIKDKETVAVSDNSIPGDPEEIPHKMLGIGKRN